MKLGRHRAYLVDCRRPELVARVLERYPPDAVVTDCPYNVSTRTPESRLRATDYGEWDHGDGLGLTLALLEQSRAAPTWLVSCADLQLSPLLAAMRGQGRSTRTAAWVKTNPSPRNGTVVPLSTVEVAAFGRLPRAWWGGHCEGLEWVGPSPHNRRRLHPNQKPLAMVARWVALACPPGGTVLDPFLGSGTTALACEAAGEGRTCVGLDSDPGALEAAGVRWGRLAEELRWAGL